MNSGPDVSVVISNYNTRTKLEECLRSVMQDLKDGGLSHEVIVVDDGSTDGSSEMVATLFPDARLLRNATNQGYARSNNSGIRTATGSAIFLLNSDTAVRPGAISVLYHILSTRMDVAAVGPRLRNPDGTVQRSCWRFPMTWLIGNSLSLFRLGLWDDYRSWGHQTDRQVNWISSAALMIRASAFEDVGLFDEQFHLYGVDVDWALRAHRKGYRHFFCVGAEVVHYGRGSWGNSQERMRWDHMQSHGLLFRKHYGVPGLAFYRVTVLFNSALRVAFWGLPYLLGNKRLGWKVTHFKRLVRWSVLGGI